MLLRKIAVSAGAALGLAVACTSPASAVVGGSDATVGTAPYRNLKGTGTAAMTDYEALPKNAPPGYCNIIWSDLDASRVAAVRGLTPSECGVILKVTGARGTQYVMAVDRTAAALDLSRTAFEKVTGQSNGLAPVKWEPADPSFGKGIYTGSKTLPGFRTWKCDSTGCR